jgi:hypothetical protein
MSDKVNPHDLIGGFASSTLSEEERQKLFNAALDDQALFDELLKDEPLREVLSDTVTRSRLLAVLSDEEPRWFGAKWRVRRTIQQTLTVAAVLTAAFLLVTVNWVIMSWLRPSGLRFTIARPVGGTIRATGITCGTSGNDCSTNFARGETIELIPQPDTGYKFVGYTGDCAPAGRTVMSAARTCGATFEPEPIAPAAAPTQTLTISPVPTGGTLEGVDVLCGSKGSACSANIPAQQIAELRPTADPEYTFMGFTGDCGPGGQVQMNGPRTCGAKFSPSAVVSVPPSLPPRTSGASPRGGRNAQPDVVAAVKSAPDQSARGTVVPPPPSSRGQTGGDAGAARGGSQGTQAPAGEVTRPPTDEEYAKTAIKAVLTEYCHAYETLDPSAVQRVYPRVDMPTLQIQLNKNKYKSVECKFADPVFNSLDAAAGTASVQVDVQRVFEHTAVKALRRHRN